MNEWEWQLLEDKSPLSSVEIRGCAVRCGDRVRLAPRVRSDIFDLALNGKIALIESMEQDYEGKIHVGVVLDDDPGRDIGLMRQPGHRFFFSIEELEPIDQRDLPPTASTTATQKKILIAGIGNIFLGDDGFGSAVASQLSAQEFPAGVRVADFGIRGLDLAYALADGYETTILVDAYPGDGAPGTIFVIETDSDELQKSGPPVGVVDAHTMNPRNVLLMAAGMGAELKRVLLVGCVPETLGPEEGQMGLSEPVANAVSEAVKVVSSLVTRILADEWPAKK
jgi:hydrogenase maturation protease